MAMEEKKTVEMIADVPIEAYRALMSGEAVNNNGLRSIKGNYFPDQPTLREKPKETIGQTIIAPVVEYSLHLLVSEVVIPLTKKVTMEKIYPFLANKWDRLTHRNSEEAEKNSVGGAGVEQDNTIIKISDYRKGA